MTSHHLCRQHNLVRKAKRTVAFSLSRTRRDSERTTRLSYIHIQGSVYNSFHYEIGLTYVGFPETKHTLKNKENIHGIPFSLSLFAYVAVSMFLHVDFLTMMS